MEKIILVTGENEYLVNKKIMEYVNSFDRNNYDFLRFDLSEIEFSDIYEEIITPSLFCDRKIVAIDNVLDLIKMRNSEINNFIRYIKNPSEDVILILKIIAKELPNDDITLELLKYAYLDDVTNFSEEDYIEYINKIVSDASYKIDENAVVELLQRVDGELFLLEQEIEKLMLYKINEKHITLQDVKDLVSKNVEDRIYELTNSLIAKNKEKMIEIYEDLLSKNEDPLKIINNISNKLKEIVIAKEFIKKNASQEDLAEYLKISLGKAFYVRKNANEADSDTVLKYIGKLSTLDYEIKSGQIDKKLGLELFLLRVK
ncbi:DNA polymerase III subunit delta [Acholeplasma sp. OttesenSCG-928-E16]|nr:DNA polymerase III subunit delta [Acholeplasma sp. OttesenSCG-928-E16]